MGHHPQTLRQQDEILGVLLEADRPLYTREVADQTPWCVLTVGQRLNVLADADLVVKSGRGRNTWRLSPAGRAVASCDQCGPGQACVCWRAA